MNQRTIVFTVVMMAAAACTPSDNAAPSPEKRSLCEARCFGERGTCRASDYDCDGIEAACKRGCQKY